MEHNTTYNLMTQLTQESKSLWRIKNNYLAEAETEEVKACWTAMIDQKEKDIATLKALLKTELQ